jgi:GNAT superfamily N-acetyltransferase
MDYTRGDNFLISTDKEHLDIDMIHTFLSRQSYWAKGVTREIVERAIANSLPFGVYHITAQGAEQVGFARVITDYATFAYVADVFVIETYRGKDLSKWLIESMRAHPDLQGLRRWLLATKDAHGLYRQYGFRELAAPERWMELTRQIGYETVTLEPVSG